MQTKKGQTSNEEKTNLRGNITVWLTSCLFCLDSVALLILNEHQLYLFDEIRTKSNRRSDVQ